MVIYTKYIEFNFFIRVSKFGLDRLECTRVVQLLAETLVKGVELVLVARSITTTSRLGSI